MIIIFPWWFLFAAEDNTWKPDKDGEVDPHARQGVANCESIPVHYIVYILLYSDIGDASTIVFLMFSFLVINLNLYHSYNEAVQYRIR